jgi:hypothetical protein
MKFLLLISALLTIAFTTLVSIPDSPYLIGGMTQADISNMYPTAITPAGVTFAIWSVIYLSWIIAWLVIAQAPLTFMTRKFFPKLSKSLSNIRIEKKVILSFSLAMALTGVWLIPWGYQWIWTALVVMLIILGILKYAFYHSRTSHIVVRSSVELTIGWINIATVANITIWLVSIGFTWGGVSEIYWAIGVLGLALLLTAYYQCRYRAYIVSLVFLWTMLGEWIAHPVLEQRVAVSIFALVTIVNMVYSYMRK